MSIIFCIKMADLKILLLAPDLERVLLDEELVYSLIWPSACYQNHLPRDLVSAARPAHIVLRSGTGNAPITPFQLSQLQSQIRNVTPGVWSSSSPTVVLRISNSQ